MYLVYDGIHYDALICHKQDGKVVTQFASDDQDVLLEMTLVGKTLHDVNFLFLGLVAESDAERSICRCAKVLFEMH